MEDLKKIAEDIASSYDARIQVVKGIAENTQKMVHGFQEQREAMSHELCNALARSEHLRKKDFSKMMEDILHTQAIRENSVKQMLVDFRGEEELISKSLRKLLLKGEKIRIKDLKNILSRIRDDQARSSKGTRERISTELVDMQKEVSEMLENFREEREKVASEWKRMATVLRSTKEKNKKE
jgi:hypothetical protein